MNDEVAVNIIVFVMTLEIEFASDKDVELALTKFIAYDSGRMHASNFMEAIKTNIEVDKLGRVLVALGYTKDYTEEQGYELLALTSYLRECVNFHMDIGQKYVDMLITGLPIEMFMFMRSLYVCNNYSIGQQSEIHDFLTELWEDTLSDEKLNKRPFAYEPEPKSIGEDKDEEGEFYFDISDEQLQASEDLAVENAAKNPKEDA